MVRFDSTVVAEFIRGIAPWAAQLPVDSRQVTRWTEALAPAAALLGRHRVIATEDRGVRTTVWSATWQ
jgi:hypothetical protein